MKNLYYGISDLYIQDYVNEKGLTIVYSPDESTFRIYFSLENEFLSSALQNSRDLFTKKIVLSNFSINLPLGKIESEKIESMYIKSYNPGRMSVFDGVLKKNLNVFNNEAGVSYFTLSIKEQFQTFNFLSIKKEKFSNEVWYKGNIIKNYMKSFLVNKDNLIVRADNDSVIFSSDVDLSEYISTFNYTWSIIQGQNISLFAILKKDKIDLYFNSMYSKNGVGKLYTKFDDIDEIFMGTLKYISNLDKSDSDKFFRYLDLYLEAKSNSSDLNYKIFFIFLIYELIKGESAEDENADQIVSNELGITKREAALIRFTRNRYIHHGADLGKAIIWAKTKAEGKYDSDKDSFYIDENDLVSTSVCFYFQCIILFENFLKKRIKINSKLNDYSYFINLKSS